MKIYNSLTRNKDEFAPLKAGKAGMYVCGPTVYDEPHIGHARSAYIFDVVRRYLKYRGFKVTFVRNVTDVDDKIIDKARKELPDEDLDGAVKKISVKYLASYHEDMASLGILPPDIEPKATDYMEKIKKFIELLIEKGCAYESGGDVYFDIKKAKRYGKLSNQNIDKMEAGARISPGEKKRDPLDFALWKKAKEGEPSWESLWGMGRPGWHIECSAMSSDILGDEFDIHGGGIDLIFPHHENEIAQSEGAGKRFARIWMHNGLLTINGEKMAKSLGNFISIKDFLAKYKDPDYLKLLFLNTHYRHPVDYSEEKINEMKSQKERFIILFEKIDRMLKTSEPAKELNRDIKEFRGKFEAAMDDDFNTPLAMASLFDLVAYMNRFMQDRVKYTDDDKAVICSVGNLMKSLSSVFGLGLATPVASGQINKKDIDLLIRQREKARIDRDFKKADEIRKRLAGQGIILEDTKDGPVWRKRL